MAEEKVAKTKIKKKKWVRIISPPLFKNEQIGEIPVIEPKALVGRAVTVNLMSLTRDMRKQNTSLKLTISSVKADNAATDLYGYYLNATSIKRLVRRGKEKIGLTVICTTSDKKRIRIMPLIIPHSKVKGSIATSFKKSAEEFIKVYASKSTFENIIRDLITNKLQREIKGALKKVYPVRILEVAKLHIERSKKPHEEKEINVIDMTEEKPKEEKEETEEKTEDKEVTETKEKEETKAEPEEKKAEDKKEAIEPKKEKKEAEKEDSKEDKK